MAQPEWRALPRAMQWLVYAWLAWALTVWCVMLWLGPAESSQRLIGTPFFFDYEVYRGQLLAFDRTGPLVTARWYYPPFAAVVFWPLRLLSAPASALCWAGMQALVLAALVRLCWSLLAGWPRLPRMAAALSVVLTSYPVCACLALGQVGLLITVLALFSLSDARRSQAWLGAAASLKLYPLLYAVGSAVRLDVKLLVRLGAWLLLLGVVVPLCWLGPSATWELYRVALGVAARASGPRFDTEQTLDALLMRMFYARSLFDSEPRALLIDLPHLLVTIVSMLSTVGLLGYALWRTRSRSASDPLVISAVLLACCLLIKPGWDHYWVVLPYAQATLLAHARRGRELAICALTLVLSGLPLWRILQPGAAQWIGLWGLFPLIGLCVLVGVCELAAPPRAVRRVALSR